MQTPLHVCAEHGFSGNVVLLVQHGADLMAKDANGFTPLDIAEKSDHVDCMSVLKQAAGILSQIFYSICLMWV